MPRPDYARDAEENKEFDEAVRRGDLKEGVRIRQREAEEKKLLGERMFDAIEVGATGTVQWLQQQAAENPDTWTDDAFRLAGGGLKNAAWALSKIPGLAQLAQAEDWLAAQARRGSETVAPWVDPRFAGWGTCIATGLIADKGIRKATGAVTKGVKVSQALSKADEIMAARKTQEFGLQMMAKIDGDLAGYQKQVRKPPRYNDLPEELAKEGRFVPTLKGTVDSRSRMNPYLTYAERKGFSDLPSPDEIKRRYKLGRSEADWFAKPEAPTPRRPFKSTPQRRWESIYQNKIKYPSVEQLDLAVSGPGYEVKGWKYVRPSGSGGTPRNKWDIITKRLQKQFGGTENQRQGFINQQRVAWKQTQNDIRQLNERFQFNYLEFSVLGLEELSTNKVIDLTKADETLFNIYLQMASNPKKYPIFELGHVRSAKNIARETAEGVVTTADYSSNLRAEIRRSIRDFTKYDPKTKTYKLIEPGNQYRKAHMDAPKIVNMMLGTSPNVEVEWIRYIGDFGNALENIIPFERHDHFMEFFRAGISKWQRSAPGGLAGPVQLDQYPRIRLKLIDDYLNMLDEGAFLDDAAKSDFIDHALTDRKTGLEAVRKREAEGRAVFRKTMPRFRGDERGAY